MDDQLTELLNDYAKDVIDEQDTDESRQNIIIFASLLWLLRADTTLEKNKAIAGIDFQPNSSIYDDYINNLESSLDNYANRLNDKARYWARKIAEEYPELPLYEQNELLFETLKQLPELEEYQAERLARTEFHNISQLADIDVVNQIVEVYGERLIIKKRWKAWSGACDICKALDGKTIGYDEPFLLQGQAVDLGDGKFVIHNYSDQLTATAHPNDFCSLEWIIESY